MKSPAWVTLKGAVWALSQAPSFAAVTVLTMALGIGASTAAFSAVDQVLLQPLPYPEADAVVVIGVDDIDPGARQVFVESLRVEPDLFAALGSWRLQRATATAPGEPERVHVVHTTEGLLDRVLGVQPFLGRAFLPEEHRADGTRTVVLSHRFWEERMGGDPDALGRAVGLDGVPYTVVGVMADGFRPPFNRRADLWIPVPRGEGLCDGHCEDSGVLARLWPGTTLAVAQARAAAIDQIVNGEDSSALTATGHAAIEPLQSALEGSAAPTLWLLFLGVATASTMALVNITVLTLVRVAARAQEFAIRRVLGAGRSDLTRQLLVEAGILALLGTVAALLLADWILEVLSVSAPPVLTGVDGLSLGPRTSALAGALGLGSALVSGLAPLALPMGAPRAGGAGAHRQWRWVEWLMGGQVAVAMVLLVAATLLTRSLHEANSAELGFDPDGLMVLEVDLPAGVLVDRIARSRLLEELRTRVLDAPGVVAVGGASPLPFLGTSEKLRFALDAESEDDRVVQMASLDRVTPAFFYTMGIPVLVGRSFDPDDAASTRPVAVVNERWARSFADFPRSNPVGRTVVQLVQGRPVPFSIIGVVSDIRPNGPRHPSEPTIYRAAAQDPPGRLALVVEVDDPSRRIRSLRRAAASTHPGIAASVVGPMDELVSRSIRSERFAARVSIVLAGSMLVIAIVGVYGTIRRAVVRRIRELGIRLALGARGADASRFALGSALRFAGTGGLVGLALAWRASPILEGLLFGVSPHDPGSLLVAVGLTFVAGAGAVWGPARAAASTEPVEVLRE